MKQVCIIQNCELESAGCLADYLKDTAVPFVVVRNDNRESLPEVRELRAIVVLGTPISILGYEEYDYLRNLFAFLTAAVKRDVPLLTICGAGQLLARVLGAKVVKSPVREIGVYSITLTPEGVKDELFDELPREIEVFHWHADAFEIPSGATLLATGEGCRDQVFRKGNAVALKTKDQIVSSYIAKADQMKRLSYRLMQNFLG
jgi:GMP synthase (glutamine-hydrolysing)